MKRAMLGVLVLAVCVMMIAPAALAEKRGGSVKVTKYSTLRDGDFIAGPDAGTWNAPRGARYWSVGESTTAGGQITIWNPLGDMAIYGEVSEDLSGNTYLTGASYQLYAVFYDTHSRMDPRALPAGEYTPGNGKIETFYLAILIPSWGSNGDIDLLLRTMTSEYPDATITVEITSDSHVIVYGTATFEYIDYNPDWYTVDYDWHDPTYGVADHYFCLEMDM